MKTSKTILNNFLKRNDININLEKYLNNSITLNNSPKQLPETIVEKIIALASKSSYKHIQTISDDVYNKYNIHLSRVQKNQLNLFLNYQTQESLNKFISSLNGNTNKNIIEYIVSKIKENNISYNNEINAFITNLKDVIYKNNINRTKDYLNFIYSRLLGLNERRNISVYNLFEENNDILKKELTENEYFLIKKKCLKYKNKNEEKESVVYIFNQIYNDIINKNFNDKYSVVYLEINQDFVNNFSSFEKIISNVFSIINKCYEILLNHRALIINIQNIIFNDINIKWKLYAYITIYCEHIKEIQANRSYYKPEIICADILKNIYKIVLTESDKQNLINYYATESEIYLQNFSFIKKKPYLVDVIKYYTHIYAGFSFIDCFVLKNENDKRNSIEIIDIENNNELLLIFHKHELDQRKIPCPVCGSLKISGNSYSEIGIKSWECKNPFCFERSKTNRGKRYSAKTNFMQNEINLSIKENLIDKKLINIFRKDVVENWTNNDLHQMIIKFFSYNNDKILLLNTNFEKQSTKFNRKIFFENIESFIQIKDSVSKEYYDFINNPLFSQIYFEKNNNKKSLIIKNNNYNEKNIELFQGNSLQVLNNLKESSINHFVTSPPYYNAREYSQWVNLYHYLNDMYSIIKACYKVICPGGVFFYNIGDIFDNEKIVSESTLGNKRIPLGAWTILLFEKAGFQLLDNIIWYKGEPQSNRQKNDGMYYPYYQRPANAYEHIFIFKKPGRLNKNKNKSENILKNNIQKFTPVIKIDSNGNNKYGHTAPYPEFLPCLSISYFTNKKESVLDPFLGSGTTVLTASKMDRKGIGIELNKEYFNLAIKKIKKSNKTTLLNFMT